jgi:hypothetical protein
VLVEDDGDRAEGSAQAGQRGAQLGVEPAVVVGV